MTTKKKLSFIFPGAAFTAVIAVFISCILLLLGNGSTPRWLAMLCDGGAAAALVVAFVAAGIWIAGLRRVGTIKDARPYSICFTRGQFDDIEVHYLDLKGHWQFNSFRDGTQNIELLQAHHPGAWARYQRRYPELHVEDARMLSRFEVGAIKRLSEIEMKHGELIAQLNRDIVHQTLDDCSRALARIREERDTANRHGGGSSAPKDLASSQADSRAIDRARKLAPLLDDLEIRMKRSKSGDQIDTSGLVLFAGETPTSKS